MIDELRDFDAACDEYWAAVGAKTWGSQVRRWRDAGGVVRWSAHCDADHADALLNRFYAAAPTPEAALDKATEKIREATAKRKAVTA